MNDQNPLNVVVEHVVNTSFDELPSKVVKRIKTFLLDTIGVGIAGTSGTKVSDLIVLAKLWGETPEATVWLTGERMSAQSAALVNAYQIHCLEFDCVHEGAVLHPMATILSSVFAWAERETLRGRVFNGRDLITALAVAIDVSTMLGIVTKAPLTFFRPATAGGFGAVAAIGKLARLDTLQLTNAFGAQYAQTSGTLQPHVEGSPMLGLQLGFNSRAAIAAIDLAIAGFRGPHDILIGPYGYFTLFEQNNYDIWPFLENLGKDWQVLQLAHKPYPSGRLTHGVVDGLSQLMHAHNFGPSDIQKIECHVPPLVHRLVGRKDIPSPEENYAKLCLKFVAGVFLKKGAVDVPDFQGKVALEDMDVHNFASIVEVVLDDNPDLNALSPQKVTVLLRSGVKHMVTLSFVYGHPNNPLTAYENEKKFKRCISYGCTNLPDGYANNLIETVEKLEYLVDITDLISLTSS
jgi:2-methylcitrate dehydratase PrpD